jgi:formate dehydrogenase subunit delta
MANDIGAFFASEKDQNLASEAIRQHIQKFWDPRMRSRIIGYYNDTGGKELEGPVRTAVQRLAEQTTAKA